MSQTYVPQRADVVITGRLGQTPTLNHTDKNNIPVTTINLAVNHSKRNPDTGEREDAGTSWFHITMWSNLAQQAVTLRKGAKIQIEGAMRWETYEKDGEERRNLKITAQSFRIVN